MSDTTPDTEAGASTAAEDPQLRATLRQSAHEIWLAGLGAFAKAQAEGGKVFDALVKEGEHLQSKVQAPLEQLSTKAEALAQQASRPWERLETALDARSQQWLERLGLPSSAAWVALQAEVGRLRQEVDALKKATRPARKSRAAQASGAAPARKRSRPAAAKAAPPDEAT
jgi:poly(hydroxyalkanoate) granule-associated protein